MHALSNKYIKSSLKKCPKHLHVQVPTGILHQLPLTRLEYPPSSGSPSQCRHPSGLSSSRTWSGKLSLVSHLRSGPTQVVLYLCDYSIAIRLPNQTVSTRRAGLPLISRAQHVILIIKCTEWRISILETTPEREMWVSRCPSFIVDEREVQKSDLPQVTQREAGELKFEHTAILNLEPARLIPVVNFTPKRAFNKSMKRQAGVLSAHTLFSICPLCKPKGDV